MYSQLEPELFHRFLEHAPVAVAMFDTQLCYLFTSARWLTDYGLENQYLIGQSLFSDVWTNPTDYWYSSAERCLQDNEEQDQLGCWIKPDGSHLWVKWQLKPWHNQTGEVAGVIIYSEVMPLPAEDQGDLNNETEPVEDLSQLEVSSKTVFLHEQTQAALRASEARFQKLAANIPGIIYQFILRANGSMALLYVSSACRQIHEVEPEEFQQTMGFDLVHPGDRLSLHETISLSAHTLQPWHWEGRIITHTGKVKWVQGISRPEKHVNGDILWDGLLIDITTRKQTESELHRYQEHLEELAAERTAELQKVNEQLMLEIAERQQKEQALRQTLHELEQAQMHLIQSEKMSSLGHLVAGIAHEINNPVNFIYGNVSHASQYVQDLLQLIHLYKKHYPRPAEEIQRAMELIDLDFVAQDLPKLMNSMEVGATRIQEIVRSLRSFSHHDEAALKRVSLHEGINNTLLILEHRLRGTAGRVPIQVIQEYGQLPLIECYAGLLNQVFMNLLTNAIDALEEGLANRNWELRMGQEDTETSSLNLSPSPLLSCALSSSSQSPIPHYPSQIPTILIQTEVLDNHQVSIRIADNGLGIPIELQPRLFEPFFTTKPIGKGTGLGLAISYQIIVEKHHGQLSCHSIPGQGTELRIEIPIHQ